MIEVADHLFVGNAADYDRKALDPDWYIISAAKDPWHRKMVGYTSRAAPKDSPKYLWASSPSHLALNLIDADDPAYIPEAIINFAITTIEDVLNGNREQRNVLVHCKQGLSRSPTIAMLYMAQAGLLTGSADEIEAQFRTKYPPYAPSKGLAGYARKALDRARTD